MAAITDLDDLAVLMTGGGAGPSEILWAYKTLWGDSLSFQYGTNSGPWRDLWRFSGVPNDAGIAPSTVTIPTKATAGAIPFTNATGGRQKFIVQAGFAGQYSDAPRTMLYDRLLHMGNLPADTTVVQTVGGVLTRNTGGEGNEIWIANDGPSNMTSNRNVIATYTNQAGVGSRVTPEYEVSNDSSLTNTVWRLPLQQGDTGVRSVESVSFVTAAGTGVKYSVIVAHPLLMFGPKGKAMTEPPWPVLEDDACLSLLQSFDVAISPSIFVISTVER